MIDLHIGADLSFNSTGLTFYTEKNNKDNTGKIADTIEFVRLIYNKNNPPYIRNLTQYVYDSNLFSTHLSLNHEINDEYNDCTNYTIDQMKITNQYFIGVNKIMQIILSRIRALGYKSSEINIYINFEGSILNGYNFNTQIGVNMLQGYLRAELFKLQIKNQFKTFKFRLIPPKALKSFFTLDGNADKTKMVKSFIENYNGKKLLPQITTDKKSVTILNDIVDSFALVAYNVYALNMDDKPLFPDPTKIKTKKKRVKSITTIMKNDIKSIDVSSLIQTNNESSNLITDILNKNNIL